MRKAVRAIVEKEGNLLVMKRTKSGKQYYSFIGGGVDKNETLEEALYREMAEEAGVEISNPRLVFIEDSETHNGVQYVFYCEYARGEPALHPKSEEAFLHSSGNNLYEPMWMKLEDFKTCTFVSERLKNATIEGLEHGFPVAPIGLQ